MAPTQLEDTAPEVVVTLTREGDAVEYRGPRYAKARTVQVNREWSVTVDGVAVGFVRYRMLTREQRTPGRMYVNKRWQAPGWEACVTPSGLSYTGRWLERSSKKDAAAWVVSESARRTKLALEAASQDTPTTD